MITYDMAQRSPEWYAVRAGLLTGSSAADMLSTLKSGKETAARRDLRMRLVCERLTGVPQENGFTSEAMQRGIDKEPDAIAEYETQMGALVTPVGFLAHGELAAGCSPDGLVGDDGLIEVKCPKSATHLAYLQAQVVPADYIPQMVHALWISQRAWCDFVSFDDRFPPRLAFFRVRMMRNEAEMASYEIQVRQLLREVDRDVETLTADPFARFEGVA